MIEKLIEIHKNHIERLYRENPFFNGEPITLEIFDKIKQFKLNNIKELTGKSYLTVVIDENHLIVYYFIPFISTKHWIKGDKNVFILQVIDNNVNSILDSGENRIENLRASKGEMYSKILKINDVENIINKEYNLL